MTSINDHKCIVNINQLKFTVYIQTCCMSSRFPTARCLWKLVRATRVCPATVGPNNSSPLPAVAGAATTPVRSVANGGHLNTGG